MLKHLIFAAATVLTLQCAATQISSLDELSNTKVVTIERRPVEADSCGYLSYEPGDDADAIDYTLKVRQTETVTDNQLWVIYYQSVDQAYYLYNLAAKRCISVGATNCQFGETGTSVKLQYLSDKESWIISDNNYTLGLANGRRNAAYFLKDMTADDYGFFYTISDNDRSLTDDDLQALNDAVTGTRRAAIDEYKRFLQVAQTLNSDGLNSYCGGYDVDDLANALADDNVENVSLVDLEQLKEKAVKSSFPSPKAYYRIKNYVRPNSGKLNNYMTLQYSCDKLFCQNSDVVGISNSTNNGENLRLFQFHSVDGLSYDCARIRVCAVDKGLQVGNKDFVVTFLDNDKASSFQLVRVAENSRLFRLQYYGQNKRLTTNGVNGGQAIAINTNTEDAMSWYIEKVESFEGPTLTNGDAALTLPCPVYVPENCEAFYISKIEAANVVATPIYDVIPAYTPFILKGEAGTTPTFTIAEVDVAPIEGNLLSGTTCRIDNTDEIMLIAKDENGNDEFVRAPATTEIAANAAYLLKSSLPVELNSIVIEEVVTGVTDVTASSTANDAKLYDLNGRRITKPARGIITVDSNGHKRRN